MLLLLLWLLLVHKEGDGLASERKTVSNEPESTFTSAASKGHQAKYSYPPPPTLCPTNNFVIKKYGPNGSVRRTRRSVRATTL